MSSRVPGGVHTVRCDDDLVVCHGTLLFPSSDFPLNIYGQLSRM